MCALFFSHDYLLHKSRDFPIIVGRILKKLSMSLRIALTRKGEPILCPRLPRGSGTLSQKGEIYPFLLICYSKIECDESLLVQKFLHTFPSEFRIQSFVSKKTKIFKLEALVKLTAFLSNYLIVASLGIHAVLVLSKDLNYPFRQYFK